jgi:phosphoglycerate kinase
MKFGINTLDDFELKGKTVLCRIDINQPVDKKTGMLKDTTRIRGSLETIRELSEKGVKTVLLAHQGSDIEYKNYYTLQPHALVLSELLNRKVRFVEDICGPAAIAAVKGLKDGEILLLENVRFMAEEMTLFETKLNLTPEEQTKTQVVQKLSPLADIYVCDAFAAAHRAQPTLIAMEELLPSAMGRLFEKEYSVLSEILESPSHPCVFVLGGAKIQDAFLMMGKVLKDNIADTVLAGGLVGQVMLAASGVDIGHPSLEFLKKNNLQEYIAISKGLLDAYGEKILLPDDLSYVENGRKTVEVKDLPVDKLFLDVGEKTVDKFTNHIINAALVFVNGPMGVFEEAETEYGTKSVWNAIAENKGKTILGGGDSISAVNKYGLQNKFSYICTGGGAMVRFLSGEELPVVKALKKAAIKFKMK